MKDTTIDRGLFRIYLGIASIVLGMLIIIAAFVLYYLTEEKLVFPELSYVVGQLFMLGATLLGFGVYKHVKLKINQQTSVNNANTT